VQIIATTASQLPLYVERDGVALSPTPSVIIRPDVNRSRRDFLSRTVINLAMSGEAFILCTYDSKGAVKIFETLDPAQVQIQYHERTGEKTFEYNNRKYSMREMKHLRLFELPGSTRGLGPIQAARQTLFGYSTLQRHSTSFVKNNGVPQGVLSAPVETDTALTEEHQRAWYAALENSGIAVLPPGYRFEALSLSPADLAFLDQMRYSVTDIARLFGVPAPYLLADQGEGGSLTYSNLSQVDQQFYRTTLLAYLQVIEDAMSSALVRGQEVKFDLTEWLRPDDKTRYETYQLGLNAGFLTLEEVREKEGLPPLPQDDETSPSETDPESESDPVV